MVALDKGVELYQVFADTEAIFKITSNLESLYVYKCDSSTGAITSPLTFRRVNIKILNNDSIKMHKKSGQSTLVYNKLYDVYTLWCDNGICGFELCSKKFYNGKKERLCFMLKHKE